MTGISKRVVAIALLAVVLAATAAFKAPVAAPMYTDPSTMTDAAFFAELDLSQPGLATVRAHVQQADYPAAKAALLNYSRGRATPVVPGMGSTPITSPMSSTADELVDYTFEFAELGQTQNFNGDIDWDYHWNPSKPTEFGPAHYYVVDFMMVHILVPAYNALPQGDPKRAQYANAFWEFALEWIADKGNTNDGLGPEPGHAGSNRLDMAKRLAAWVSAYDAFKNEPSLDADANVAVLKHLWQMSNRLYYTIEGTSGNNWYMSIARSLYKSGVYLPEFADSANWRSRAEGATSKYFANNFKGDGMNVEPTEGYHLYALSLANEIKNLAAINGRPVLTGIDEGLERAGEVLTDLLLPNLEGPQLGDSASVNYGGEQLLKDFAGYFDRPDFLYIGSKRAQGTPPTRLSVMHPNSFAVMRTGWSANDNYLMVENSDTPYAGSHNHPDDLSLSLYAYGKRLIADPGVYNYLSTGPGPWLRLQTEAHNTVEVNNAPQSNIERKQVSWRSNGGFDFYHGKHRDYAPINHDRKVFFVKPGFWIVSDLMSGSTITNTYEQLWHFPPTTVSLNGTTKRASTSFSGEANVKVVPADPATVTAAVRDGYYSPQPNVVSDAQYLAYTKSATGTTSFDTVLFPEPAGANRNVTVSRLSTGVATTTATALQIAQDAGNGGNTGTYYLSHEASPATRSFGGFTTNGEVAYVEKSANGNLVSASLGRGSALTEGAVNLIGSAVPIGDLSVRYQGTALAVTAGDAFAGPVTIYAPAATTVTLNGAAATFMRTGDYVTIAAPAIPSTGTTVIDEDFGVTGLDNQAWSFDDANGSTGLRPESGTWAVAPYAGSNAFRQSNFSQANARALTATSDWTDSLVEAKVTPVAKAGTFYGASLFARYQDDQHHYEFQYTSNGGAPELRIVKRFIGAATVLASVPFTMSLGTTYTMKAVASGDTLKLFVNGVERLTAYDRQILGGAAGVGTHKTDTYFDDLKVTDIVDGDTWKVDRGYFLINNSELFADSLDEDASQLSSLRANDLTDVTATANVKVTAWGSQPGWVGLTTTTLGTNDTYRFVAYNTGTERRLRIERVVSGLPAQAAPTVLAEKAYPLTTGTSYAFAVRSYRGLLTFSVNGVQELSARDTLLSRGGFGFTTSRAQARFDNARLQTLP